jgi:protoporphyrinogen IX oxidase
VAWTLVFHLFGVIFWLGNLLVISSILGMVPEEVGITKERFIVAGRRLLKVGANVGAAVAIVFGIVLVMLEPKVLAEGWFHVKLALVLALLVIHWRLYRRVMALEDDPATASPREFKIVHGLVSLLLLGILILALVKPF